jgi:hypothetical protein
MTSIFFISLEKLDFLRVLDAKNRNKRLVLFFLAQPSPIGNQTLILTAKYKPMKKAFTLLTFALGFATFAVAQNANAVVFSENGEKFTLILNGEKQNETPQTNVKVVGLVGEFFQARIDFEDPSLPDFTQKTFSVKQGMVTTYAVKTTKKGEWVCRWQTEAAIGSSSTVSTPESSTQVVDYVVEHDGDMEEDMEVDAEEITMTTTVTPATSTVTVKPATTGTTTTTTTTTTVKPGTTGEKVNVNMNVGGVSMGINMNIEGMETEMDVQESTTVTKTTTTKTTSTTTPAPAAPRPREEVVVTTTGGCSRPMDQASFAGAKKSIEDKGFDDTRLTLAKQVVKSNCMSSAQIKQVMEVFGFEETKLEFAKYAYDYCTDKNNYYMINDAFSFSSSIDDLNSYLESK